MFVSVFERRKSCDRARLSSSLFVVSLRREKKKKRKPENIHMQQESTHCSSYRCVRERECLLIQPGTFLINNIFSFFQSRHDSSKLSPMDVSSTIRIATYFSVGQHRFELFLIYSYIITIWRRVGTSAVFLPFSPLSARACYTGGVDGAVQGNQLSPAAREKISPSLLREPEDNFAELN